MRVITDTDREAIAYMVCAHDITKDVLDDLRAGIQKIDGQHVQASVYIIRIFEQLSLLDDTYIIDKAASHPDIPSRLNWINNGLGFLDALNNFCQNNALDLKDAIQYCDQYYPGVYCHGIQLLNSRLNEADYPLA